MFALPAHGTNDEEKSSYPSPSLSRISLNKMGVSSGMVEYDVNTAWKAMVPAIQIIV